MFPQARHLKPMPFIYFTNFLVLNPRARALLVFIRAVYVKTVLHLQHQVNAITSLVGERSKSFRNGQSLKFPFEVLFVVKRLRYQSSRHSAVT